MGVPEFAIVTGRRNRVRMRRADFVLFVALILVTANSCKEKAELPLEKPRVAGPEMPVDLTCVASFKADASFSIPNLVFSIEYDTADAAWMRVTLASTRSGPDGARLFFYSMEHARPLAEMKTRSIDFASGHRMDLRGNGVFTATTAYQPKLASIVVTRYDDQQISGIIRGEFYRHQTGLPLARPEVVEAEAEFTAKLVIRQ